MPNILTFNKIAADGLFPDNYACGGDVAAPEAIMVRSTSLHETAFDPATLAIARAGAGVNNASIMLVGWGQGKITGFFPKGMKAGFEQVVKDNQTLTDAEGGK